LSVVRSGGRQSRCRWRRHAADGAAVLADARYGFYYDDYHFVRPYPAHEVRAAFHGPWDASGIETPYYRPLTICVYAARFAVLGLNAPAYHVLSLMLFVAAGGAVRGAGDADHGNAPARRVVGAAVFAVHRACPIRPLRG
jgi:hypothetical protein